MGRFEFESDEERESIVGRFVDFHNNGRMGMVKDYNIQIYMNKLWMEEFQKA